ncbi:helix-turn-helix transcriptional regulator [Streptomyces sp. MS1.AVA.1]|uniref:Helix-turn-helix transcriptional regulator n=1 Tax=Streptomyces machairae TaxID=3134109 RepID=A0ABU8USH1_9ACTN
MIVPLCAGATRPPTRLGTNPPPGNRDRIRTRRRAAGLSQLQLGERIGRDHKTIHRWETAQRAPDLTDLLLVADTLGIPLADLVR